MKYETVSVFNALSVTIPKCFESLKQTEIRQQLCVSEACLCDGSDS